jgi:DNA topoisomerase-1
MNCWSRASTILFNVEYTAHMEGELDEIEEGRMIWTDTLAEFYGKFTKDLAVAKENMRDVKRQEIITDEKCENCGSPMAKKFGRYGQFLACTNYPSARPTRDLAKVNDEAGKRLTLKRPRRSARTAASLCR